MGQPGGHEASYVTGFGVIFFLYFLNLHLYPQRMPVSNGVIDPLPCPSRPRMSWFKKTGGSHRPASPSQDSPDLHPKSENQNGEDEDRRTVAKRECRCSSNILAFIDIYQSRRRSPSVSVGTLVTFWLSLTLASRKERPEAGCSSWGRWHCGRCCTGGRAGISPPRCHPECHLRHV